MKLFIIGHALHGKTYAAKYLRSMSGIQFADSSRFAAAEVVKPYMALHHGLHYTTAEDCWLDRHNHRDKWYTAISEYNSPDLTRLSRAIFAENDIYVGIRNRDEFWASKHLSDLAIWVDASDRVGLEPSSSMTIKREDADVVIENNHDVSAFKHKLFRLMYTLGLQKVELHA